jgi:hypothetical protein
MNLVRKLLFVLLATSAHQGIAFGQTLGTPNYFPLNIGDRHTYYEAFPCPPESVWSRSSGPVLQDSIIDTTVVDGKKYYVGFYGGMARVDTMGNVINRAAGFDQVYYKLNASVGDTWSYKVNSGGQDYTYTVTMQSRTDTVRVHAGTFVNCLRIFFDIPGVSDAQLTHWLAPEVGLVFRCQWEPRELYEATVGGIHYPIVTNVEIEANSTQLFVLYQNYPNPFNPSSTIQFGLPTRSIVTLEVFNLLGQKIAVLASGVYEAGNQQVVWKPQDATGIYFYRIVATSLSNPTNHFVSTKKLMILR